MTRRLSLAGQLLALQVVIICVVLVGVTAVTVAQSTKRAQEVEGRRAQAVAETLANSRALRDAVDRGHARVHQGRSRDHPQQLGIDLRGRGAARTGRSSRAPTPSELNSSLRHR